MIKIVLFDFWRNWYTAIESRNTEEIHYIYIVAGSNPVKTNFTIFYGEMAELVDAVP